MQMQTILKVVDNSGVKYVRCIKVLGGFKKKTAKLGDRIVVSVVKVKPLQRKFKILKGDILHAIIVGSKTKYFRKNGASISYRFNSVILLKDNKLIGTRVLLPLIKEFRVTKYTKLLSLAINAI